MGQSEMRAFKKKRENDKLAGIVCGSDKSKDEKVETPVYRF